MNNQKIIDNAIDLFNNDYNCAQSVLLANIHALAIDKDAAINLSSGFGAGMGRLQKTCGAVTGAFLTISLHYGNIFEENNKKKEVANLKIQEFHQLFVEKHGTSECYSLLDCDLNSEEGQRKFTHENLKKTICEECIKDTIKIIDKVIQS